MGKSFDFIVSKDQQENILKIVARNGGRVVSEKPVENGIAFRVGKSSEPLD